MSKISEVLKLPIGTPWSEIYEAIEQDWERGTPIKPGVVGEEGCACFSTGKMIGFALIHDYRRVKFEEFRYIRRTTHSRSPLELYGRLPDGHIQHIGNLRPPRKHELRARRP